MEKIMAYIEGLVAGVVDPEVLTSMWTQAIIRSEAVQGATILFALFIATKLRASLEEYTLPKQFQHVKNLELFINHTSFSLPWLVSLVIARGFFSTFNLPVTYIDIAALVLVAWVAYKMLKHTKLKTGTKRFITVCVLAIPGLMITDRMGDVIHFLDGAQFTLGENSISLWSIVKAGIVFTILIWLFKTGVQTLDKQFRRSKAITASMRTLLTKLMHITGLTLAGLIALDTIGVDLSALAFFGGALGIGIGFGLRTITSNFMSGIILLLDKSVKPGDVLTVGETYGMVEELNSRYIVMRRRDGMEVLVPNENLITSEVINWSYNNKQVRHTVTVGISYDSDLEQVQQILLDVAKRHKRILQKPGPRAFIVGFGDSSINFEIRFWINDPEEGLGSVRSDLYMGIWKRFKKEGIEIPFPQRVLHKADEKVADNFSHIDLNKL
jgi:small-conductance mechanosensitive channel